MLNCVSRLFCVKLLRACPDVEAQGKELTATIAWDTAELDSESFSSPCHEALSGEFAVQVETGTPPMVAIFSSPASKSGFRGPSAQTGAGVLLRKSCLHMFACRMVDDISVICMRWWATLRCGCHFVPQGWLLRPTSSVPWRRTPRRRLGRGSRRMSLIGWRLMHAAGIQDLLLLSRNVYKMKVFWQWRNWKAALKHLLTIEGFKIQCFEDAPWIQSEWLTPCRVSFFLVLLFKNCFVWLACLVYYTCVGGLNFVVALRKLLESLCCSMSAPTTPRLDEEWGDCTQVITESCPLTLFAQALFEQCKPGSGRGTHHEPPLCYRQHLLWKSFQ